MSLTNTLFRLARASATGRAVRKGPAALANIFDFSPKVKPENCVLVGVRDIDAVEKENDRRAGIGVFTMRDID
mgnify:CR=1 FL=1